MILKPTVHRFKIAHLSRCFLRLVFLCRVTESTFTRRQTDSTGPTWPGEVLKSNGYPLAPDKNLSMYPSHRVHCSRYCLKIRSCSYARETDRGKKKISWTIVAGDRGEKNENPEGGCDGRFIASETETAGALKGVRHLYTTCFQKTFGFFNQDPSFFSGRPGVRPLHVVPSRFPDGYIVRRLSRRRRRSQSPRRKISHECRPRWNSESRRYGFRAFVRKKWTNKKKKRKEKNGWRTEETFEMLSHVFPRIKLHTRACRESFSSLLYILLICAGPANKCPKRGKSILYVHARSHAGFTAATVHTVRIVIGSHDDIVVTIISQQ